MRKSMFIVVLVLAVAPAALATNGYFTHGTGTQNKARAGAGVALSLEAMDSAGNPAAAVWLDRGYSASLALFSPDRQYTIKGAPSGYPQTFGLTPGTVESKSNYFPMPAFAANFRLSDTSAAAVSMLARGGMNTDYRAATFYGSDHTGVDLAQMFLNATYAKKLTKNHSVGLSVIGVGQRFKASGLEAFGQMTHDAANLTGNGYDYSWGAGAEIGYLGHLTPNFSVGGTWMPQISMSKLDKYDGLFSDHGSFDIPSAFTGGIAYRATDTLTVAADYQRIHFSDVGSVGNHFLPNLMTSPLGTEHASGFGWDDVNVVKLGATWDATPEWSFSAGFSKCNQPIPDSEVLFNILAPGVIEKHITFGIGKALNSRPGRFNVAFMYAPSQTVTGSNPLEAPGQQQIELKMSEWELELGYNF